MAFNSFDWNLWDAIRKLERIKMKDLSIITSDGYHIAYRLDGPAGGPILLLSNSIGTDLTMWDPQVDAFSNHFQVLRYDSRGHGASDVPAGPYSVDRLGRDVVELLDALKISRVHFLGLSLGGMVGQWLGVHVPERIDRLILANTAANLEPVDQWSDRITSVLKADRSETAEMFLRNWFPPSMRESNGPIVAKIRAVLLTTEPQGFAGSFAAVRDMDMRRTIALISAPTLVIAGQYDTVTLPSHSELIAATVPGAKLVVLPVLHLSNLESPEAFMSVVLDFLL
jgi:3-oxoadipate enol-lactonase